MQLLTRAIEKALPPLYTHEGKEPSTVPVVVKFFNPTGAGTWYITEGERDGDDWRLYGWADLGMGPGCSELGYTSLNELKAFRGRFGLGVERDLYLSPMTLADAMAKSR